MELSRYVFSALREGGFSLYRGSGDGRVAPCPAAGASLGAYSLPSVIVKRPPAVDRRETCPSIQHTFRRPPMARARSL
jgi:hypothetical protein